MRALYCLITTFVIGMLLLCSCKKNNSEGTTGSTEPPQITLLETSVPTISDTVCGELYDNVLRLITGTSFTLKMQFTGSNELAQYKIDIHNNFDCHVHERPISDWSYLKVEDISGKDKVVTEEIPLPADTYAGNYHCIIRLIDGWGNEAEFVEFNLKVINSEDSVAPEISRSSPASDSIVAAVGDIIIFKGTVTDNLSLKDGRLEIDYQDATGKDYSAIKEFFPGEDVVEYNFERPYTIPPYISSGTAVFTLKAYDKYNNSSQQSIKIYIVK